MLSTEILERWRPRTDPEIINATPFIIRGHHLANLRLIATGEKSPDELAQGIVEYAVRSGAWSPIDMIDLIGTTVEEREHFSDTASMYFKRFMDLPEDFPVRIVAGQEDGICSGCAVGNHCARKVNADSDIAYISRLKLLVERLNSYGGTQRQLDSADDGKGLPAVVTTAGVVKEVLELSRLEE